MFCWWHIVLVFRLFRRNTDLFSSVLLFTLSIYLSTELFRVKRNFCPCFLSYFLYGTNLFNIKFTRYELLDSIVKSFSTHTKQRGFQTFPTFFLNEDILTPRHLNTRFQDVSTPRCWDISTYILNIFNPCIYLFNPYF